MACRASTSWTRRLRVGPAALTLAGIAPLFVPATAMSAVAAATAGQRAYASCMQHAMSTVSMQECQQAGLADAEQRLRSAIATVRAKLPADQRVKFALAQTQWRAFRRSDCGVFFGKETGTIATVQAGQCLIDRTEDRIRQLRDFTAK